MDFLSVLLSISIMGIIIIIGMLISLKITITNDAKQLLIMIIINVAMPCIILNGVFNSDINEELLSQMLAIFLIAVVLNCLGIGLGWLAAILFGFKSLKARKIAILAGLGNTGFIGIPLCAAVFGPTGGLLAAIFDAGLDVTIFTIVVLMLQKKEEFSFRSLKALINIPIIAIVVGVTIAIIGFQPPVLLKQLTSMLASLAAPLAMLYIGMLIPAIFKNKTKSISIQFLSIPIMMKLIVFPLSTILLLMLFIVHPEVKQVVIIQAAMPTFMLASILFARYAQDEETGVMTTVYSTIVSLATIPIIAYIASLAL